MPGSGEQFASLPSGIDLCHETFGSEDDPAILLVMGLGGPMGWWSTAFCERLADKGWFVIRYDNRDTGRSTKLRQHRVTKLDIVKAAIGVGSAPYSVGDMAEDAVGLIDHLGLDAVHVVGVSLGGMIAQMMAIEHPKRVLSLTSIMSTTGNKRVGWPHPKVIRGMLSSPGRTRESYAERSIKGAQMIASPKYPTSREESLARAYETYDRGWTASGVSRQLVAALTAPDRTERLRELDLPVTVLHGKSDPLIHRSGGTATARAIRDAELIEVEGMGHDLPEPLWDTLIDAIVSTAERSLER